MRRFFFLFLFFILIPNSAFAKSESGTMNDERMRLYRKVESLTRVPWYYLAAIDQYELNIRLVRRDLPKPAGFSGLLIPEEKWAGMLNPNQTDTNPLSIRFFGGMGRDGNGDGLADRNDPEDALFSIADYIRQYGTEEEWIKIALWDYYQRDKTVGIITNISKLFRTFGTVNLDDKQFPFALNVNFSYRDTWGHKRGWGGRRIHEGTDIFAGYGVHIYSTCYGVVEIMGWNKFGGWRIGIRDKNNTYHYFAHLNGFAGGIKPGTIVKPGQLIGFVGSSGYGPPGTAGKFPPHLHFGLYKDDGRTEWSFDPYPHLKRWEREAKIKRK